MKTCRRFNYVRLQNQHIASAHAQNTFLSHLLKRGQFPPHFNWGKGLPPLLSYLSCSPSVDRWSDLYPSLALDDLGFNCYLLQCYKKHREGICWLQEGNRMKSLLFHIPKEKGEQKHFSISVSSHPSSGCETCFSSDEFLHNEFA